MWTAFKLLSWKAKAGIVAAIALTLIAVVVGSYFYGRSDGRMESEIAITNYQKNISDLEAELANKQTTVVTKVLTEYVDRIKEVEVERVRTETIVKEVPAQFPLSNGWIYVHNSAVQGTIATEELASDPASSGIFDVEALPYIVDNYNICKVNSIRHNALIDWVEGTLASAEEVNNEAN